MQEKGKSAIQQKKKEDKDDHPWACPSGRGRPLPRIGQGLTPLHGGTKIYMETGVVVRFSRPKVCIQLVGPISGPTVGWFLKKKKDACILGYMCCAKSRQKRHKFHYKSPKNRHYLINKRRLVKLLFKDTLLENGTQLHMSPLFQIRALMISRNRCN